MPRKSSRISSRPSSSASAGSIQRAVVEFNPDYTHVKRDLKRIAILAGSFFVLLIALSFVLPYVIR